MTYLKYSISRMLSKEILLVKILKPEFFFYRTNSISRAKIAKNRQNLVPDAYGRITSFNAIKFKRNLIAPIIFTE